MDLLPFDAYEVMERDGRVPIAGSGVAPLTRGDRTVILAEGDSWLAYPRSYFLLGAAANIVDHLRGGDYEGLLLVDYSSNGDEALQILSGDSKTKLLRKLHKARIDVLLFSAGGNDIVGEFNFYYLLKDFRPGYTWRDCIEHDRVARKIDQVSAAYQDLIELCATYSANPQLKIVSHTYDLALPRADGAVFLSGLLKISGGRSWMHPYLVARGITDEAMQTQIVHYMLQTFRDMLLGLADKFPDRFIVVDTHGSLDPERDWLNEIHPTSEGFAKITRAIYDRGIAAAH